MARPVPPTSSASAIRGIWFVFQHAGQTIALWVSSFTGKEELYINGALTAEKRKIALQSTHEFAVGGSRYALSLATTNLRRGVFECLLRKDGRTVAGQQTEYVTKRRWRQSLLIGVGSSAFAYLAFAGKWSPLASIAGIAVVAGISFALFGRENGYVIRPIPGSTLSTTVKVGNGEA